MTGEGIVVKTSGISATVKTERSSACSGECSSCGMCENPVFYIEAENRIGAKNGDKVKLFMPTKKVYMSAFLVYMLPILVLLCVLGICSALNVKTYVTAFSLLTCAAVWFAIIRKYNKSASLINEIIEIIE